MNADTNSETRTRAAAVKAVAIVALTMLLSGCSIISQPPSEAKARRLEEGRLAAERGAHLQADTKRLEDRGLSGREARSLAEAPR